MSDFIPNLDPYSFPSPNKCYLPVDLVVYAALEQQLLVVDAEEGVPVYALVQHLVRVDGVLLP